MKTENILVLPTAAQATVKQARRVGRFPKIVTRLSTARCDHKLREWQDKVIADAIEMAIFQIDMSQRCERSWRMQLAHLVNPDMTSSDRQQLACEIEKSGLPLPQLLPAGT